MSDNINKGIETRSDALIDYLCCTSYELSTLWKYTDITRRIYHGTDQIDSNLEEYIVCMGVLSDIKYMSTRSSISTLDNHTIVTYQDYLRNLNVGTPEVVGRVMKRMDRVASRHQGCASIHKDVPINSSYYI